jgi:hypothetical protein
VLEPFLNLRGEERANTFQFQQRTFGGEQISRFLGPEKGITRRAAKSALPQAFRFFCSTREQLRQLCVREWP